MIYEDMRKQVKKLMWEGEGRISKEYPREIIISLLKDDPLLSKEEEEKRWSLAEMRANFLDYLDNGGEPFGLVKFKEN